jgi:hypothetical protein
MHRHSSVRPAQSPLEEREMRECRSCYGSGRVLLDATYDPETGELVQETTDCFLCGGRDTMSVFLYGPKRA